MINRIPLRYVILGLLVLILASVATVVAATNTVPGSRLTSKSVAINANALKPTECAALTLVNTIICPASGTCTGTTKADLILGTGIADTITGKGGNDCILGGGGNDDITGGNGGGDVCIGGPGTDTFHSCETVIQ